MANKNFKPSDPVFDVVKGNGYVSNIRKSLDKTRDVVSVFFENSNSHGHYWMDGRAQSTDLIPSLYHGHNLQVNIKEPAYEYKVVYTNSANGPLSFDLSTRWYATLEEFNHSVDKGLEFYEFYLPSKRIRK